MSGDLCTATSLRWAILLLLAQGCDSTSNSRQAEIFQTTLAPASSAGSLKTIGTSPGAQLSEVEEYISAAGGILKTLNEQDTRLAVVMAGATTGESTLGMIRDAVRRAQAVESAGFHGDYNPAKVPTGFQALDKRIRKTYQLHEAAFNELLEYWKDSNVAHISSGNASLQRAVVLTNECITDLNQKMKLIEPK